MSDDVLPQKDGATGRFLPGNSMSKGNPLCGKVMKLKRAMLDATDEATVAKLMVGLLGIALDDPSGKVRIAATMAYLSYAVGKPTERIEMDVTTDAPSTHIPINLDSTDIVALESIRRKLTAPPSVIDAEVIQ